MPEHPLTLFAEWQSFAEKGLAAAIENRNSSLARLNLRQLFLHAIQRGLYRWRTGSESPRQDFEEALTTVHRAQTLLPQLAPETIAMDIFPKGAPSVVSYLLYGNATGIVDAEGAVHEASSDPAERAGILVSDALLDRTSAQDALMLISDKPWPKQLTLFKRSHEIYLSLLAGEETDALVKEAEDLFRWRSRDGYYTGGHAIYGGGPDNGTSVDFVLAAVLKKIAYRGSSIHSWIY